MAQIWLYNTQKVWDYSVTNSAGPQWFSYSTKSIEFNLQYIILASCFRPNDYFRGAGSPRVYLGMGSPARPENSRPGWAKSAHGARLGPKMHVLPKDGPGFFGLRAGIGPRFFARRLGHKRLGPRLLALGFFWSGPTRKIPRYTREYPPQLRICDSSKENACDPATDRVARIGRPTSRSRVA
jgi:hypothetical protein